MISFVITCRIINEFENLFTKIPNYWLNSKELKLKGTLKAKTLAKFKTKVESRGVSMQSLDNYGILCMIVRSMYDTGKLFSFSVFTITNSSKRSIFNRNMYCDRLVNFTYVNFKTIFKWAFIFRGMVSRIPQVQQHLRLFCFVLFFVFVILFCFFFNGFYFFCLFRAPHRLLSQFHWFPASRLCISPGRVGL